MTTSLMPSARQRGWTNAGQPAAGCLLYTYEAGTTTPKATYTDAAGLVPHTNPIVLDSKGEALIYWSGNYKIDLRTAAGVQVTGYPVDNFESMLVGSALAASTGSGLMGFLYAAPYSAGTIGRWLQDLALSTGSSFVNFISSVSGSVSRTIQSVLREDVRLLDHIPEAQHAAILAHTSTYDASDAIIAALAAASAIPGGAKVVASRGKFRCTKPIPIPVNVVIEGKSKMATIFAFEHLGNGFTSNSPINTSTAVNIGIEKCTIVNTNAANTGGAFVDVAGSYIYLYRCKIYGFKFGAILDQSEHVSIDLNEFITPDGGTGIWMVNGPDYTPGALVQFTNRIEITRNQFNATPAALHNILDDGGACHTIRDNNFNAGALGIRAANAYGLTIGGNEMEVHTTGDIYICDTTLSGTYVGPCVGFEISGNSAISPGVYNVGMQHGMNGRIVGNNFGQAPACINFLNGAANQSTGSVIEANTKLVVGVGKTAGPFVSGFSRSIRNNSIRQTAVTYSALASLTGSVVITPASMEFIGIGTRMHMMNEDGTNGEDVIVTATTATTFTAVLTSVKSANFLIYGATPQDQEQGAWTPVLRGAGVAGTNTYSVQVGQFSRRGNEVHVSCSITISAKDAAMAGALEISGLPFATQNVTNYIASANVGIFGGFTFAAGYTQLSGIVVANATSVLLRKCGSAVAQTTVPATDCPGATIDVYFNLSYLTSAL